MKQDLKSLWLAETIRLIEKEKGSFIDHDVNRQVKMLNVPLSCRIIKRAEILSEQNGLKQAQIHCIHSAKLTVFLFLLFGLFSGFGLGIGALAKNPVNLYWAIFCLLGLHFITLLIWIFSFLFLPNESGKFFIPIWYWIANKFTKKTTVTQIIPAFFSLVGKNGRWLLSTILHFIWFMVLLTTLITLIALLSTQYYSFEWKSTLLTADSIISITHFLGKIPAIIGFSLPTIDVIRSSENAITLGSVRSEWAIWLLGIFIVYGVLLRFILFMGCLLKWRIFCKNLVLKTDYPEYFHLVNTLQSTVEKSIIDEDDKNLDLNLIKQTESLSGSKNVLVAMDISEDWLPPNKIQFLGFFNNRQQRDIIFQHLESHPAKKLLIAIDTNRIPDRGMINFIHSLMQKSEDSRIWLINDERQADNWRTQLKELKIQNSDYTWLL